MSELDIFSLQAELLTGNIENLIGSRQSIYGDDVDRFCFLKILNQDWIEAEGDMIRIQKSTQHRSNSRGDE